MVKADRLKETTSAILAIMWAGRISIFMAFACLLVLLAPGLATDEIQEALQRTAESTITEPWRWFELFITLMWLSATLYYCCTASILINRIPEWGDATKRFMAASCCATLVSAIPFAAVASVCLSAAVPTGGIYVSHVALVSAGSVFMIIAVALCLIAVVLYLNARKKDYRYNSKRSTERTTVKATMGTLSRGARHLIIINSILWMAAIIVTCTPLSVHASILGIIPLLLTATATWTTVATLVSIISVAKKVPLIPIALTLSIIFSAADCNDDHMIRLLNSSSTIELPVDENSPGFSYTNSYASLWTWLASRKDKAEYAGKSYPIVLVSTEGGGIRAAHLTAQVLASIQDRCPRFAEHIYAISSVSGGSLGASVFAGLISRQERYSPGLTSHLRTKPTLQEQSDRVLDHDFLSPLVAKMLFCDSFQQFVPWPMPCCDRAVGLEQSVENAWSEETGGDEFSRSFYDLWKSKNQGVPPLLINATNVETGSRVAITPHHIPQWALNKLNEPVSLSTAAILGARFPFITPAGSVDAINSGLLLNQWDNAGVFDGKVRIVDGGYYDNSGAASLLDLIKGIESEEYYILHPRGSFFPDDRPLVDPELRLPKYYFILVRISTVTIAESYPGQGMGEILSPMRAIVNARNARGSDATNELELSEYSWVDADNQPDYYSFEFFISPSKDNPMPLGWLLSKRASDTIKLQVDSTVLVRRPWGSLATVSNMQARDGIISEIAPQSHSIAVSFVIDLYGIC